MEFDSVLPFTYVTFEKKIHLVNNQNFENTNVLFIF